jgi:hypothetical protein
VSESKAAGVGRSKNERRAFRFYSNNDSGLTMIQLTPSGLTYRDAIKFCTHAHQRSVPLRPTSLARLSPTRRSRGAVKGMSDGEIVKEKEI